MENVEAVVIATAVLENIAKLLNESVPPNNEEEAAVNFVGNVNIQPYVHFHNILNNKYAVRYQLVKYFNEL